MSFAREAIGGEKAALVVVAENPPLQTEIQDAAARAAVAMWESAKPDPGHSFLTRKDVPNFGLRVGEWVNEWTDPGTGEIAIIRVPGTLMIPIHASAKSIVSLQAIFPSERAGHDMTFLTGGCRTGCYFMIGKPREIDGMLWVVICEGYATGASIYRATGIGVMVAFDAGNLAPVAARLRSMLPNAGIVIAADNDQWTLKPIENPGLTRARSAAKDVGARVAIPDFSSLEGRPNDFNDLDQLDGEVAVEAQIMGVISTRRAAGAAAEPVEQDDGPPLDEAPPHNGDWDGGELYGDSRFEDDLPDDPIKKEPEAYFVVLGHDLDQIYFYQHEMKMVVPRPFTYLTEATLTSLAPLKWWETAFPGRGKGGFNCKVAVDWLQQVARSRGHFDPKRARGRGACIDQGRVVYHFGNVLMVDGVLTDLLTIKSEYYYGQASKLNQPDDTPLSNEDGQRLFKLASIFRWTRKAEGEKPSASAMMLIGWAALAPLCGALKWRPHIWITGGAGSGKTTILTLVAWLLNDVLLHAQGNSTEAGIRQELGSDARPVVLDEAENNNEQEDVRIKALLAMIRQSSSETGAKTYKGTAAGKSMNFMVRSMFCLGSIQVSIKQQADQERFVKLELRSKKRTTDEEMDDGAIWSDVQALRSDIMADKGLPARLMRRSLDLLPTTLENIRTFSKAAAGRFGSQRAGDQYGALLAGAWSLTSNKLVSLLEAEQVIDRYSWDEYMEGNDEEESSHALGALLSAQIWMHKGQDLTVSELIRRAAGMRVDMVTDTSPPEANAILRRNGMMVVGDGRAAQLCLANNFLKAPKLMEGTPFHADLRSQLLRVPGSRSSGDISKDFNGHKVKYVILPIDQVIDRDEEPTSTDPAYGEDRRYSRPIGPGAQACNGSMPSCVPPDK